MAKEKSFLKGLGKTCAALGVAVLLYLIAYIFAFIAHTRGYYVQLGHFKALSTFDLWDNVTTGMMVWSVMYLVGWIVLAYWSGKTEKPAVFAGMMLYSGLSIVGLLGLFFIGKNNTLAMLPAFLSFPWSAPYQALLVAGGSIASFKIGFYSLMAIMPVFAVIAYVFGKKIQ